MQPRAFCVASASGIDYSLWDWIHPWTGYHKIFIQTRDGVHATMIIIQNSDTDKYNEFGAEKNIEINFTNLFLLLESLERFL